uniref:Uncharacterized protein n=5 Tax=Lepeophtheirus salmonis TaxID=72036 RepID=A0A0K2TAL9_LEPSM
MSKVIFIFQFGLILLYVLHGFYTEVDPLLKCCGNVPLKKNRSIITLGYLTAVKGNMHNR